MDEEKDKYGGKRMIKKVILCILIVCVIGMVLGLFLWKYEKTNSGSNDTFEEVIEDNVGGDEVNTSTPDVLVKDEIEVEDEAAKGTDEVAEPSEEVVVEKEEPTVTEVPMETSTPSPSEDVISTPVATTTPTKAPTSTPTATKEPVATTSPSTKPTESPSATSTPKPTQAPTLTPVATPTPTVAPTPVPTAAPTPTPAPVVVECSKGADGKHYFLATSKKADCYNEGCNYEICAWCGATRNEVPIPKTTHDWYEWYYTNPNCINEGWLIHTCRNCNEGWGESTPPLGHEWETIVISEGSCIKERGTQMVCSVCGSKLEAKWHGYDYNNHVGEWIAGSEEVINDDTWETEIRHYEYCSACLNRR